jgi:hypothetical protein
MSGHHGHSGSHHDAQFAKHIVSEMKHGHAEQARQELAKELHAHPKEAEKILKMIEKSLHGDHHKHHIKHDKHGHISHIDFSGHDIYDSHAKNHAHKHK